MSQGLKSLFLLSFSSLLVLPACEGGETSAGTGGTAGYTPGRYGVIRVFDAKYSFSPNYTINAHFKDVESPGTWWKACEQTIEGQCTLSRCPKGVYPPGSSGAFLRGDAGDITVTSSTESSTISPDADSVYIGRIVPWKELWQSGDVLKVEAKGGSVPAFQLELAAPTQVELLAPQIPAQGEVLTISRESDLSIEWKGTTVGKVLMGLSNYGDKSLTESVTVDCEFDPSSGMGSMPKGLLAQMPTTSKYAIGVFTVNRTSIDVDGWDVTFEAMTNPLESNVFYATMEIRLE